MEPKNPKVDVFLKRRAGRWLEVMTALREILLECGLSEDLKWAQPCYMFNGSNVIILGGFKDYCMLSFFKGALLKDPQEILRKPGENTQSARVIRFKEVGEIKKLKKILKAYIKEAMKVEKSGLKVELKKITERKIPDELERKFEELPALKTAFATLTPGRQRAYLMYFSSAKQAQTREARIEKYLDKILDGLGMED
jgi:uncharacterized protein YdeI (YjbR/CyaY-like superfamily)